MFSSVMNFTGSSREQGQTLLVNTLCLWSVMKRRTLEDTIRIFSNVHFWSKQVLSCSLEVGAGDDLIAVQSRHIMMRMARQIWKQTKSCLERLKCLTVSLIYWKEPADIECRLVSSSKMLLRDTNDGRNVQSAVNRGDLYLTALSHRFVWTPEISTFKSCQYSLTSTLTFL